MTSSRDEDANSGRGRSRPPNLPVEYGGRRMQHSREPAPAPDLQFQQLTGILRRRKRLIFVVAMFGTMLAVAAGLLIPPKYKVKAQLVVGQESVGDVKGQTAAIRPEDEAANIDTHVIALGSRDHLQRVVDSLSEDPEFRPHDMDWFRPWTWLADTGALSVDDLDRRLKVNRELRSRVIAVEFSSTNPKRAVAVANRVVQLYVESQDKQKRAYLNREMGQLSELVQQTRNEVERAQSAMQKYRAAHGLPRTEVGIPAARRTDRIDWQLVDLRNQLGLVKADLARRHGQQAHLRDLNGSGAVVELGQKTEHEGAQGAGDDARVRAIQQRLAIAQGAGLAAVEVEAPLRELARNVAASGQLYGSLLRHQQEIREQLDMVAPDIRIISAAVPPNRPSSPAPVLFIFPALIIASIAGSLLAVAAERLDRGLRSAREIEDALGIPCIGLVPKLHGMGKERPHHYLQSKPFAVYTEAIRSVVVATLRLGALGTRPKVILITSSVPKEGKTTLAVSFALYAAFLRPRVLLVDFDLRHPATLREFGEFDGKLKNGVFDLLNQDRPIEEVIQRIPGSSLDYLPVSSSPVDPLRLFAGEEVLCLMGQLRENYDCVVIDSPPLLAVTEARLLASMADKVLFAVQWGSTKREVAQNALSLLRNPGFVAKDCSATASAVVTQVNLQKHALYRYGDSGECLVKYKKYFS